MSFNPSKCKHMHISRKRNPILLGITNLKGIKMFKYLGVLISCDLSWSLHVDNNYIICSKTRKIIGLLYRQFYHHANKLTLLKHVVSLVRPHTEYAASVWNPHLQRDIQQLENVQKFGLRVCTKLWQSDYSELLELTGVPSLASRRLYSCLCCVYKIICFFSIRHFVPPRAKNIQHQGYFTTSTFCKNKFLASLFCIPPLSVILELPASMSGKC